MKLDKRKLLGPLFRPLSKAKHSRASRILVALFWLPSQLLRQHNNKPYFYVNIASPKGMGAVITEALLMCHYAVQNNLTPNIISTNPLYTKDRKSDFISNYLGTLLSDKSPNLKPMQFQTLWSFYHLNMDEHITLKESNRFFWTYFPPKPVISDIIDKILSEIPNQLFDLSIHYRGTDKALEAPLISFEIYKNAVLNYQTKNNKIKSIFLATDDADFETYIKNQFPNLTFTTYNLGLTSDASRGRHFSDISPEEKAIEAIVNIFLLSRSPCLIRGASYMSAISKIINLELKTVTLNRTHWGSTGFPEMEILAEEDNQNNT